MTAAHCIVVGRVQGVGYRLFVQREALRLSLRGTVANRDDGSVEVWAEGAPAALREFVGLLARGPMRARVDEVVTDWLDRPRGADSFRIVR